MAPVISFVPSLGSTTSAWSRRWRREQIHGDGAGPPNNHGGYANNRSDGGASIRRSNHDQNDPYLGLDPHNTDGGRLAGRHRAP